MWFDRSYTSGFPSRRECSEYFQHTASANLPMATRLWPVASSVGSAVDVDRERDYFSPVGELARRSGKWWVTPGELGTKVDGVPVVLSRKSLSYLAYVAINEWSMLGEINGFDLCLGEVDDAVRSGSFPNPLLEW
ncbi:hypothetical protein U1Q18_026002 [Sarracenia purpurea var. burkii]